MRVDATLSTGVRGGALIHIHTRLPILLQTETWMTPALQGPAMRHVMYSLLYVQVINLHKYDVQIRKSINVPWSRSWDLHRAVSSHSAYCWDIHWWSSCSRQSRRHSHSYRHTAMSRSHTCHWCTGRQSHYSASLWIKTKQQPITFLFWVQWISVYYALFGNIIALYNGREQYQIMYHSVCIYMELQRTSKNTVVLLKLLYLV